MVLLDKKLEAKLIRRFGLDKQKLSKKSIQYALLSKMIDIGVAEVNGFHSIRPMWPNIDWRKAMELLRSFGLDAQPNLEIDEDKLKSLLEELDDE